MSLRFLLDTNIISEPLRPMPNGKILDRLQRHQSEVAIATIVWHELWFGCNRLPKSARRTTIENYLNQVVSPAIPILPYSQLAAEWHAGERARLASIGKTPSFADGQIMAIAKTNDLVLVTLNTSDYSGFADIELSDWQS